jgi:outer membrane protein assembly factor BamB
MTTRKNRNRVRAGAAIGLALGLAACGVRQPPSADAGTSGPADPGGMVPGEGATLPAPSRGATCEGLGAPGSIVWTRVLGSASVLDAHTLVSDGIGHVLFARGTHPTISTSLVGAGEVQLGQLDGAVRARFPAGVTVAADAHGNAYVAGSFTAPIDLGLGTMTPEGNIDVFVAKLSPRGQVIFAEQLGLCGDGVQAIAVAADGRIAVSGTALGTAVVDANGKLMFTLPYSGKVAFDSQGDLVVAGSFTGSMDLGGGAIDAGFASEGFVAAVDADGQALWNHVLAATAQGFAPQVVVTSLAIDAHDHLLIGGFTDAQLDLFGTTITPHFAEVGRVGGGFAALLDASGAPIWEQDAGMTEVDAVAFVPDGGIALGGAVTSEGGFFRITDVEKLDTSGAPRWIHEEFPARGYGKALGLATDACGAVYLSAVALDTVNPTSPLHTYAIKLAP